MNNVRDWILRVYAWLVYVFLYAPVLVLVIYSFNLSLQTAHWLGFTTKWYAQVFRDEELIESAWNSLEVALVTTLLAVIIGTTAALGLARLGERRGAGTKSLLFLPIVFPEIVVGAAMFTFFVSLHWDLGFWTIVTAHVSFSISYVAIVVRARLAGFDKSLEEAARDLGAGPLGVFWRVKLPLILPGVIAGALLVFTLSIDDYVITSFVAGIKTLPLLMYEKIKINATPETNAISTLLLIATIAMIALAQWLIRNPRRKTMKTTHFMIISFTVLLFTLTGCKKDNQQAQRVVNVYSWSEYLPQEIRDKFTAKTGIKIKVTLYENNEKLVDKLQAGVSDFDLVVPSDYTIALLKRQNLLQKIDSSKIANWKNLDSRLLSREYDPKNEYSAPCFWGTTGIGYNKKVIPSVDSWSVMFDEKNSGKILMLDDSRECLAMALKLMGKSLNEKDPAVLKQAGEMLKAQKKLVRVRSSDDFDQTLARGDVALAHGYNGQLAKLVATNREKFAYVVPKEGATMWIDSFCIPAKAKNVAEAHELLNFLLDPEIGAELVNKVSYASGNKAAQAGIKPEILKDPSIYPSDEVIKRCEVMADLGDETTALIDKIWQEVMVK